MIFVSHNGDVSPQTYQSPGEIYECALDSGYREDRLVSVILR